MPSNARTSTAAVTLEVLFRLMAVAALVAALIAVPGVAHADQIRDQQWHLDYLDIEEAHRISRGAGVTVAVLDGGVDYTHPDLEGALLEGRTFAGGSRGDGWEDHNGHGTAMATLIAGRGHGPDNRDGVLGIAPEAMILPVRVKGKGFTENAALAQGIEWAIEHGADVINISLAGHDDPRVEEAINAALDAGIVIIAGAGNTANLDTEVTYPARYPGVVAVSGIDRDGNFTEESVSGNEVALAAPAVDIVAGELPDSGSRYGVATGTSNSAAIVSGVAALVKSKYPHLDAANIINRLIHTANDRGPDGRDPQYGYGIIDPVAALTEDVPEVDTNPLITPSTSPSPTTSPTTLNAGTGLTPTSYTLIGTGTLLALIVAGLGVALIVRRRRSAGVAQRVSPPPQPLSGPTPQPHPPAPPPQTGLISGPPVAAPPGHATPGPIPPGTPPPGGPTTNTSPPGTPPPPHQPGPPQPWR